jgi:hypothetical protein
MDKNFRWSSKEFRTRPGLVAQGRLLGVCCVSDDKDACRSLSEGFW